MESASELGLDERKLYELIWKRTVACQMADARVKRTSITLLTQAGTFGDVRFSASGKTIEFAGYLRAYVEGSDNPDEALADRETLLPPLVKGERLRCEKLDAASHATQPPPRLTEASLVKELELRGIGRPSTYASILETILERGYVFKRGSALVPTLTAFVVIQLLERYLAHLVDYGFTAKMEDDLDAIALGEKKSLDYLEQFYRGNGAPGLKTTLDRVQGEIDPREICAIELGKLGGKTVEARVGRFGPYLNCDGKRASLPGDLAPEDLTLTRAVELLTKAAEGPRSIGNDPKSGLPVYVKVGRFGPYFQLGDASPGGEKPKMASLLKDMTPETVTLDEALAVLALPRAIGQHPDSGLDVVVANGRFGPYVQCGKDTRSIPESQSPIKIALDEALELLRQPKTRGRARTPRASNAKVLGQSPVTGKDVKLLDGRFGPYVTDGATNASLPKDTPADSVNLDRALELLALRAARGPVQRKGARRRRASAGK
jgi:DNA topoisomerase-1